MVEHGLFAAVGPLHHQLLELVVDCATLSKRANHLVLYRQDATAQAPMAQPPLDFRVNRILGSALVRLVMAIDGKDPCLADHESKGSLTKRPRKARILYDHLDTVCVTPARQSVRRRAVSARAEELEQLDVNPHRQQRADPEADEA